MSEQLRLVGEPGDAGPRISGGIAPAAQAPVARVLVETVHPHLAHAFDYGVPRELAAEAVPGVRVRVRFAGRLVSGFILDRVDTTEHVGDLTPLKSVVSPLPVLRPRLLALCRAVALRFAGALPDVLRLAIPPRHARAETALLARPAGVDADALAAACRRVIEHDSPAGTEPAAPPDPTEKPDPTELRKPTQPAQPADATDPQKPVGPQNPDAAPEPDAPEPAEPHKSAESQESVESADSTQTDESSHSTQTDDANEPSQAEDAAERPGDDATPPDPMPPAWSNYLQALEAWAEGPGGADRPGPRAAFTVLPGSQPGTGWIRAGVRAAAAVLARGRDVLWLVPDNRELDALAEGLGPLGPHAVRLSAEQGPQARWTAWTTALTGRARLVIGTRAAAFAPLENVGLVLCVDDGNDSYLEQRAPYPHARAVLIERVRLGGAALLMLDCTRTVAVAQLVAAGWLGNVDLPRPLRRAEAPLVLLPREAESMADLSNLPERAFFVIRTALRGGKRDEAVGPVLVQVPRTGYAPVVACANCRELLRCPRCSHRLAAAGPQGPYACRGCGLELPHTRCQNCGDGRTRSVAVGLDGVRRQLGRAFPHVRIVQSGGGSVLPTVEPGPAIVVATTGAEPYVDGGYAAAVLMDSLWPGPTLRATERSIARRMRALSLVRAARLGGRAVVLDEDPAVVETLVRYAPDLWAEAEAAERAAAHLPPAIRTLEATGDRATCTELVAELERFGHPRVLEVREPDPAEGDEKPRDRGEPPPQPTFVIGIPLAEGDAITGAAADWVAARSLHRQPMPHTRVDDPDAL